MTTDFAALVSGNLDVWTTAVERRSGAGRSGGKRVSLYGIDRLRALVLDLAIRGKLIRQDPSDEPASVLLERIENEKRRLIAARVTKRPVVMVKPRTWPFDVPQNWAWTQLGWITNYGETEKANPGDVDDDTWVLELEDIEKGTSRVLERVRHSSRRFQSQKNRFRIDDVIYGKLRPYLDKVIVADEDGVCSTEMVPMRGYVGLEPGYLRLFLKTPFFIDLATNSTHGMNLPRLGTDKAREAPFALPPLAQQKRIVAKVDEFMALCDALEGESAAATATHQTLVEVLLGALTDCIDDAGLAATWTWLEEHFDSLFTTEASVNALKQAILDLAMRGRFTDQRHRPSVPVQLKSVARLQNGYAFKSEWFSDHGIRLLRNINVSHGFADWDEVAYLPEETAAGYERFRLHAGDVVLTLDRPFISTGTKVAKVAEHDLPALLLQRVGRFQLSDRLISDFVYLWVCSPLFSEQIDPGRSNGVPHISSKQVETAKIYVPSVSEQRRIVAEVDKLMDLCENLKLRIAEAGKTQRDLADAIVERAAA